MLHQVGVGEPLLEVPCARRIGPGGRPRSRQEDDRREPERRDRSANEECLSAWEMQNACSPAPTRAGVDSFV